MPLATAFENHRFVERASRVRQNPLLAYGAAVLAVVVATLLRQLIGGQAMEGLPFITYYPAIVIAALLGGFWAGVLATLLSAAAAWYLFIPPAFSLELTKPELVALSLFFVTAGINVIVVALLNAVVERIMAQQQSMRVLIESAPNGIVVVDDQGTIRLVNAGTEKLFGYGRGELVGRNVELLVPEPRAATHRKARDVFQVKPEGRAMGVGRDLSGRRKDGSEFPVEVGLNPVSRNGQSAVLATVIDITERKRAQESQKLIVRELQHRTRNLFAVFQAIASRTVDESKTPAETKFVLNGRLQALARAYDMLADASWEGASLDALLGRQFAAFSNRVSVSGCDIMVSPSATQQFALIVHELATNALKYGALSDPYGRVSVEGRIERLDGGGIFSFSWTETGGPPVAKPTRTGFGSIILLDSAKQFADRVTLDYARQGVRYELQIQLDAIGASHQQQAGASVSDFRAASLPNKS
jgi:PAS domain S-box-containing protein